MGLRAWPSQYSPSLKQWVNYTVKRLPIFLSPAEMSPTKLSLAGTNSIIPVFLHFLQFTFKITSRSCCFERKRLKNFVAELNLSRQSRSPPKNQTIHIFYTWLDTWLNLHNTHATSTHITQNCTFMLLSLQTVRPGLKMLKFFTNIYCFFHILLPCH